MRKLAFLLLLFLCCSTLNLKAERPVRFGVVGGMNLSYVQEGKSYVGYHFGGKVEYCFVKNVYLESGLLFSRKGSKGYENSSTKLHTSYIELPIHIGYKFNTSHNISFFVSGGGYLAYNLKTGDQYKGPVMGPVMDKRFDCGVGFKGGVELFKRVQLSVSYDLGLIDTFKESKKTKNRNAMFSCAYMF